LARQGHALITGKLELHIDRVTGGACFFTRLLDALTTSDDDAHATFTLHHGLTEEAQLGVWLTKRLGKIAEANILRFAFN
jgi:hypothetical protein